MIKEGQKFPKFTVRNQADEEITEKDLKGKTSVLFFYPRDNTPGCTKEACAFRDDMSKFKRRGVQVFGVSKDSVKSHAGFIEKQSLNFPLLSDPDLNIIKAAGAWGEKKMYGKTSMGIIRSTVILDENLKVLKVFPKVKPAEHAQEVLTALKELG